MKITAGDTVINATPINEGNVHYKGRVIEGIRLVSEGDPFTPEQIDDLMNNPWMEYSDEDELLSTVTGYNTMYQSSVVFSKVPDVIKENEELKSALAEKEAALQAALARLELQNGGGKSYGA